MAHLIDKSALVSEIENIRKQCIVRDDFDNGWYFALDKVLSLINSFEEKDVDLEKELNKLDSTLYDKEVNLDKEIDKELDEEWYGEYISHEKFKKSAKHFFELGMVTSNKVQKGE